MDSIIPGAAPPDPPLNLPRFLLLTQGSWDITFHRWDKSLLDGDEPLLSWFRKEECRGLREVQRRLDEVELDVAHLRSQLQKLRGRLTGGIRHEETSESTEANRTDPRMPAGLDPISRRIWERRLARRAALFQTDGGDT